MRTGSSPLRCADSPLPPSAQVREAALLPGFVASVTADAVFVRFLGSLTGEREGGRESTAACTWGGCVCVHALASVCARV